MKQGTSPPSGIIRVEKDRSHPYKTINTSFANDERLSWGARGVMVYLLSKPDDWKVMPKDLIAQSPAGRDAVYAILHNLETCGYLMRVRTRRNDGTFEYSTVIYEVAQPLTAFPDTVEPLTGYPLTAEPLTVKPYVLTSKEGLTMDVVGVTAKRPPTVVGTLMELGVTRGQAINAVKVNPELSLDDVGHIAAWVQTQQPQYAIGTLVGYLKEGMLPPMPGSTGKQSIEIDWTNSSQVQAYMNGAYDR